MPIGAAIGGSVIGAGASIISGNKAAKAQTQASNAQIAEERRQYDTTRADYAPWRTAGASAIGMLGNAYGLNGQPPDNSAFFTSPGYAFRQQQGLQAVDRGAAARGLLHSGAAVKAEQRFGEGLAAQEYDSWWNRLAGIAGVGQAATAGTAQAGQSATSGIASALQNAGNARASSYANTGSAVNSGINNVLSAYLYNQGGGFGGGK